MSRGNSKSHNNSWIGYCRLSRTMITGYKKKKLGHPSEKLSGDVPRASWRAVIFSEVIFPVIMAILFVIAYLFVKSFPDSTGKYPPSPLIRIAVISLGPVVWNAAILLTLFLVSLFLGPMLDPVFPKFGSVIASIAHFLGVVGMLGFFEFLVSLLSTSCLESDIFFPLVVPWVMECLTCCLGSCLCNRYSTCYSQDPYLRLPFSWIQTWWDQPGVVDWSLVWPRTWCPCDVAARSRVYCQNHRALIMEFGSSPWTYVAVHAYASHPYTLLWSLARNSAMWVFFWP